MDKQTPEKRLYDYWQKRLPANALTAFDAPLRRTASLLESSNAVARLIAGGYPLTFAEYHLAIAHGFLMTELPYAEFFRTRWHETKTHQGYGNKRECSFCKAERAEQRAGGVAKSGV